MARKSPQVPGAALAQPDAVAAAVAAGVHVESGDLPNAIDIDPNTIAGPVLTRQGWVCPVEKPRENAPR